MAGWLGPMPLVIEKRSATTALIREFNVSSSLSLSKESLLHIGSL